MTIVRLKRHRPAATTRRDLRDEGAAYRIELYRSGDYWFWNVWRPDGTHLDGGKNWGFKFEARGKARKAVARDLRTDVSTYLVPV